MGLVNLLSELADRLQSDAKRFTEDKDKILQSIESLSDLLKSDSCKSISKAQKDAALCDLEKAYKLSKTIQDSIDLMSRDASQLFASQEVNSLLSVRDVEKKPFTSHMNACSTKAVGDPSHECSNFIAIVKVVIRGLVKKHFASEHCRKILRILGLSPPGDCNKLDNEDESAESNFKKDLVLGASQCAWCASQEVEVDLEVESCDSDSDNDGVSDTDFQLSDSESADLQNQMFKYLKNTFQALIADAVLTGRFDLKIYDIGVSGENVEQTKVYKFEQKSSIGTTETQLHIVDVNRGMPWTAVAKKYRKLSGAKEGFYLSHVVRNSRKAIVLAVAINKRSEKLRSEDTLYTLYRPNTGRQVTVETLGELESKYKKVRPYEAQPHWIQHYEFSKKSCSHLYWHGVCKTVSLGIECIIGLQNPTYNILAGCELSLWPKAEDLLYRRMGHKYSTMQILRLHTKGGLKIIVGKLIPNSCKENLLVALREDSENME